MTRKAKKKVTKDGGGERVRRKFIPWDSDRVSPESASSLDVLMAWLTKPGNADRWRRERPAGMCREIIKALEANGILHRELGDVRNKIGLLERKFTSAAAHLSLKGQADAFQRGEADQEVVSEVLRLCPLYRELAPVFGRVMVGKNTQSTARDAAIGAATAAATAVDKSNGTTALPRAAVVVTGGDKSAAGKWKESLEKDRNKVVAQNKEKDGIRKKVLEKALSGVNGVQKAKQSDARNGDKKAEREIRQNTATKSGGGKAEEKESSYAVKNGKQGVVEANEGNAAVAVYDKPNGGAEKDKDEEVGQQSHASMEKSIAVEEEDGILADVEEDQSGADEDKQSIDEEEKKDEDKLLHVEQEETQVNRESEDESSEEEEKEPGTAHVRVKRTLKTKQQQSESEVSTSEEEGSEEEKGESEEEQEDDDDGEEKIQLAQPDEVDEDDDDEEETAEQNRLDEEDQDKAEDMEETEEEKEVEEEPEQGSSKAEESDSNLNESESEGPDNEEDVPPTQLKADSEHEEESQHENEEAGDDDAGMDEDAQKPIEQERTARKRSSSSDSSSPCTKRSRKDSDPSDATRDLEREAFIERAKQERDQRDELFQLERAKLACELQAKQVQLVMERSLARKKLLGAGVDPTEVDRVLPL